MVKTLFDMDISRVIEQHIQCSSSQTLQGSVQTSHKRTTTTQIDDTRTPVGANARAASRCFSSALCRVP